MKKLIAQIIGVSRLKRKEKKKYDGNIETMISTGSTLLDLAISGGRVKGGGLPGGILVEAFGPSGCGKTVLLCEIAGAVQRQGGEILFRDPEARLNKQFARIFDLDTDEMDYKTPDRVPEVFKAVRDWEPENTKIINGVFTDSLAALSTDIEMDNEDGDKMGMRRAKEFSEQTRRTCRVITANNYLMVCSNQVRQNAGAGMFEEKTKTPGGEAIPYYSSVRLKFSGKKKLKKEIKVNGKKVRKVYGVQTIVEVYKNSCWKPYRNAPLIIVFDYGIDDIRANLQYLKDFSTANTYDINEKSFKAINDAIEYIEENQLENELKEMVISRWEQIEEMFEENRVKKRR